MALNPNSKRGQVRLKFNSDGQEAAAKLAAKLGVAESKQRRWFRMWSGDKPAASDGDAAPIRRDRSVVTAARRDPKNRIRWRGTGASPGHRLLGTVLERGPEQSLVVWDNGNEHIVANEWIIGADEPDPPPPPPIKRKRLKH